MEEHLSWKKRFQIRESEEMKTIVKFCTKVNKIGTFTKQGHLRILKTKNYKLDKILNVSHSIRIENEDYVIMRLAFSSNPRGLTQEIWVVPA